MPAPVNDIIPRLGYIRSSLGMMSAKEICPKESSLTQALISFRIEVSRLSQVAVHPGLAMLSEIGPVFMVQIGIHYNRFHGLNLLKDRHYRV